MGKLRNASQISEEKKMKTSFAGAIVSIILAVSNVDAFSTSSSFSGSQVTRIQNNNNNGLVMEYIPSGMSKEQWKKMKESEKGKNKGKNLGKTGISTFKSRSFSDWQKAGGKNLFPVDPKSVKSAKELPYMQRPGGSADDSDIGGKKKKKAGFSLFSGKKKEPKVEPEKKKNPWTF